MDTSEIIKQQAQVISQMSKLIDMYTSQSNHSRLFFNPPINTIANDSKIEMADDDDITELPDLSDADYKKLIGYEKKPETQE